MTIPGMVGDHAWDGFSVVYIFQGAFGLWANPELPPSCPLTAPKAPQSCSLVMSTKPPNKLTGTGRQADEQDHVLSQADALTKKGAHKKMLKPMFQIAIIIL